MNQFEMHWRVFLYLKCIVSYTIYDSKMPRLFDQRVSSLVLKMLSSTSRISPVHCYLTNFCSCFCFVTSARDFDFPCSEYCFSFMSWMMPRSNVRYIYFSQVSQLSMQAHISNLSLIHCNFLLVLLHSPPLWSYRQNSIQCLWFT